MVADINQKEAILRHADRLAVLQKLSLINNAEEPFFDRMTVLASQVIGAPVSLVSMVTSTYQYFKSSYGLPEPWQSQRQTPLTHSFCQHVVANEKPLIIEDAREHPLVRDNLAIPDLNVIGYLGVPLQTDMGYTLGSFCVIDSEPHQWTDDDLRIMTVFGEILNAELDARVAAYRKDELQAYIAHQRPSLDKLANDLDGVVETKAIVKRLAQFRDEII